MEYRDRDLPEHLKRRSPDFAPEELHITDNDLDDIYGELVDMMWKESKEERE